MAQPTVSIGDDQDTVTITCSRQEALALIVCAEYRPLPEVLAVVKALVGSPTWQRDAGEGIDGPIGRQEVIDFRQRRGLPNP